MAFVSIALLLLLVFVCGNDSILNRVHVSEDNAASNTALSQQHETASRVNPRLAQSITLDLNNVLHTVDPEFLSFTIPAYQIQDNFDLINFSLPRVQNLARGLNPAMLRVGGTSGDELIFVNSPQREGDTTNFTMTTSQWDALNQFVEKVGWKFVFGLNSILRNPWPTGPWDSSNARLLLNYTITKGYDVNLELGNEPSIWTNHNPQLKIPASEHAKDFDILHQLLQELDYHPSYLVGPDVCCSTTYFAEFLQSVTKGLLNATTWHHYYSPSPGYPLSDFYNVSLLDTFIVRATEYVDMQKKYLPTAHIWLGETSSMFRGGASKHAESYIDGFMWLDKLGISAVTGHARVFRQDFVMFHYALLNATQEPTPDYWLSLLHKRLVGTQVMYVLDSLTHGRYLRAYAHCAKPPYPTGSVALILLNMNFTSISAQLVNAELATSSRDVYWLTPPNGNLTSTSVLLNGQLLRLVDNTELPELKPVEEPASPTITLPPISFGIYVFKQTKAPACS